MSKVVYIRSPLFPDKKLQDNVISAIKGQSGIVKMDDTEKSTNNEVAQEEIKARVSSSGKNQVTS